MAVTENIIAEIGEKYGPFDLTLIECGAYGEFWPYIHMLPEESARAHIEVRGEWLIPVHWAKFNLSFHPWKEPVERLDSICNELNIKVLYPKLGETIRIHDSATTNAWWKNLN
jgi:L-ascorbate metabolism protein UlaG (beta-lactamase superfamily)